MESSASYSDICPEALLAELPGDQVAREKVVSESGVDPWVWIDLPCPCKLQRALRKTGMVLLLMCHGADGEWQVSMAGMAINDKMFGL